MHQQEMRASFIKIEQRIKKEGNYDVWSIAFYGSETWTLRNYERDR